jgi:hypothetical protein
VLRTETGGPWIVLGQPDFAGAIKGLRTVESIRNAVDTALAAAKIKADESARKIRESLRILADDGKGFEFLFNDRLGLISKAPDDLRLLVRSRIADHQAAEAKRLEAERERIRAEEQAKAQREAAAAAAAATAAATAAAAQPAAAPAPLPAAAVVVSIARPAPAPAPVANEAATLKLGAICERLGFVVSASFIGDSLGIQPAAREGVARLYTETQFRAICGAIARHVTALCEPVAA